ncbi:MAG TPA: hypothetical protein VK203_28410, partial [Nostocaceae cyanobacterium]|nr:hypothetical protein [Nostocaceae cyanobacterium]
YYLPLTIARVDGLTPTINKIPAQTINQLKPEIPPLVEEAVCNSANGGCLSGALNQNANNINAATNAANNDLLSKIGALLNGLSVGLDAASLAKLDTIDNKLGEQLPDGGIAGKLKRGFKWLQIDRALNLFTLITTIHNAFMLSSSIKDTLIQALSNIFFTAGLKDEDGNAFDINQIINSSVENFVKGIIGAENYQQITENFAKANRIYQAGINVLNSIQNLSSTILVVLELIGSKIAWIGNGLKKSGVVLENAYQWFNPNPNYENPWMARLEKLDEAANSVAMVTQIPIDVATAVTDVNTSTAELIKAVKGEEEGTREGNGINIPDYKKLREEAEKTKLASQGKDVNNTDKLEAEVD